YIRSVNSERDNNKISEGELKAVKTFYTFLPSSVRNTFYDNYLKDKVDSKDIRYIGEEEPGEPWYYTWLPTLVTLFIFGVFWFMIMQQAQGGGGGRVMSFGKSKAKLHREDEGKLIDFDDVAGLVEEKEELKEIVDFLRAPRKYVDI